MKIKLGFVSNSSSEAFICNTELERDEIISKLMKILNFYNDITNSHLTFNRVFREPIMKASEEDEENIRGYKDKWNTNDNLKNKVILYSASDNSIPYALFEIIEEAFNCTERIHLG